MKKDLLTIGILFCVAVSNGMASLPDSSSVQLLEDVQTYNDSTSGRIISQTTNRFPLLLNDAKNYFVEAIIADHYRDTLEVVYLIEKIVDLLTEAEQLGEMSEEDEEEFNRFENVLMYAYENYFQTLDHVETPITVASLREELAAYMEPLEIEINGSKFRIIDDREGHIPLVINKRVEQAIKFFQTRGKREFQKWLSRYAVYKNLVVDVLTKNELPEELIFHAMVESGLNPKAYSRAHAAGMWQFVSATAKKYGLKRTWWIDERRDPVKSTQAAANYLKDLYIEFDDWYLALAAYNAGSARINRAIRLHQTRDFWGLNSLPRETRDHVSTFLAAAIIARDPQNYGFKTPNSDPIEFDEVVIEKSADLTVLAACAGITVKKLKTYNPELRQFATPPDQTYTLKLPKGTGEKFSQAFATLPDEKRFAPQYLVHVVRKGENLSYIANKYRVSIHDIAAVNKIRNYHRLRIGQKLTIPIPSFGGTATVVSSKVPTGQKKIVYRVKKGDTLSHIALRYGITARSIRQWNGLRYGEHIYPRQELTILVPSTDRTFASASSPSSDYSKIVYTVKRGDTLSEIAEQYRTRISKIRRWNGLRYGEYIYPGQKLVLYIEE